MDNLKEITPGGERPHRLPSGKGIDVLTMGARTDNLLTASTLLAVQLAVIIGASKITYSSHIDAASYGYFRDVSIMIFFGFGFLMTFLYRHGLSAIGYCLVLSTLVCEMSILVEYLLNNGDEVQHINGKYPITIENMMNALFCSGAVMISYGAVIGKVTPFQLVVMTIVEVFAFWANIRFCFTEIEAHDVGGGMVIHTFGAYFGIAATWWVTRPENVGTNEEKSIYSSDIFSLAGTIFLWVLWPSFQSAVAGEPQRQFLAICNTFFSLCSSTIAFAIFSRFLNNNKFDVVHMQNATLAGGVAMGVAGDMDMGVHGAMLGGFAGGLLSCVGYSKIQPVLTRCGIHDTCGVNNLHGMPGILGAIIGIIVTAKFDNGKEHGPTEGFEGIGADKQAQALFCSLGMGLGCGFLAGFLMSKPCEALGVSVPDSEYFNDRLYFGAAEDYGEKVAPDPAGS